MKRSNESQGRPKEINALITLAPVEERPPAKENAEEFNPCRTQSRMRFQLLRQMRFQLLRQMRFQLLRQMRFQLLRQESGSSGLDRVRKAAKGDKKLQFTTLLHHVNIELLRSSYYGLKKQAAAGVECAFKFLRQRDEVERL